MEVGRFLPSLQNSPFLLSGNRVVTPQWFRQKCLLAGRKLQGGGCGCGYDVMRGGCAVFCTCVEIKRRGGAKRGCVDERLLKVLLHTDRSFFWVGKTTLAKRKIASVQIYLEPCRCQETSVVGVLACWALVSCYKQGRKKKQVRRIVAVFNKGEQLGAERAVSHCPREGRSTFLQRQKAMTTGGPEKLKAGTWDIPAGMDVSGNGASSLYQILEFSRLLAFTMMSSGGELKGSFKSMR